MFEVKHIIETQLVYVFQWPGGFLRREFSKGCVFVVRCVTECELLEFVFDCCYLQRGGVSVCTVPEILTPQGLRIYLFEQGLLRGGGGIFRGRCRCECCGCG